MDNNNERGAARLREFIDVIVRLARQTLEDVSDEQMKKIFTDSVNAHNQQPVKPMKDKNLKKVRQLLIETPLPYIKRDVEEGFEELNIAEKLQLLLEAQDKYKHRTTKAWRPPSNPHQHMTALRVAAKRELLYKYQILLTMKRRHADQLKDQFQKKKASSGEASDLKEVRRRLEKVHEMNARFDQSHQNVVERQVKHIKKTENYLVRPPPLMNHKNDA